MTREEAITMLLDLKDGYLVLIRQYPSLKRIMLTTQAIDIAIEALHREEAEAKGWCHRIRPKDVEVVVRCKDCKHWFPHTQCGFDEDNDEYHDYCGLLIPDDDYYAYRRKADDFCSYGERKGGDDE